MRVNVVIPTMVKGMRFNVSNAPTMSPGPGCERDVHNGEHTARAPSPVSLLGYTLTTMGYTLGFSSFRHILEIPGTYKRVNIPVPVPNSFIPGTQECQ